MADKVLFNIAGGIIGSLAGPLVAGEIGLLWGAKAEVEKLRDTISAIKAVLLHAEEQRATNPAVDHWLGRLNNVIYDADDLLDVISTEALRRQIMTQDKKAKKVLIFFSESNQLAFRLKMAHKIKVIRERLDAIAIDMRGFHFVERLVETPIKIMGRDSTYSFVCGEEIIGRESDKEAVIKSLLDTNIEGNVSILPIVGIGGMGKTTLAQLIFNDEKIQEYFEVKLWVCVSDPFDVKTIVEKILESATKKKPETIQMTTLVEHLQKQIGGKKYFLVLDDLWNEDVEKWFQLKKLLMGGAIGSRILVTTRSEKVGRVTHTIKPYILKGLGKKESWNLFKKMAFKNGQEPKNLSIVEIGREVVRKCVGVPLALGTMGRMLSLKDSFAEWLRFRDNELSKISQNKEIGILSTLKLSYDILPSHLKHCFVYCSLFPKDHKFEESTLIELWIAQGFVEAQGNRCLEDIGHDYLMELVSRLFFQVDKLFDKVRFKMHDLLHDLAISMAGSLIITRLDNNDGNNIHKSRHISICGDSNFSSLFEASWARTFICFEWKIDFENIISKFKLLRVLIFRNTNVECVPSYISELKHLRYLDLSHNINIKKLPNSIVELVNLQTLILYGCKRLEELPSDITRLVKLTHLYNFRCKLQCMPRGISQLTNLQTLTLFEVNLHSPSKHNAEFSELHGLNNLKGQLEIYDWSNGIRGEASESKSVDVNVKSVFNRLTLKGITKVDVDVSDDDMVLQGLQFQDCQGSGLLKCLSSLTSLVKLTIYSIKRCQNLPPLCQFPYLEKVHLEKMNDLEYIFGYDDRNGFSSSSVPKPCFPSLKHLSISHCRNLKGWLWRDSLSEVDNGRNISAAEYLLLPVFSCLSYLSISYCPMLTSMPIFPHINDRLCLRCVSWKPLQQTLAAFSSTPLSKLKGLQLVSVIELETLAMDGLENLTSLEFLEISCSNKFKSLCQGLKNLTALTHLSFRYCPELN